MTTIYLIRHTEIYNPNKLCVGQSEIPLAENFTVTFDWIKERLPSTNTIKFFSSPLRRCSKLAQYLSDEKNQIDERLRDQSFGLWEMQAWDQIAAKEVEKYQNDFVNFCPKKGENLLDVNERIHDFLSAILSDDEQSEIVLLTHALPIRLILAEALEIPLENIFSLQIDYGSISKMTYDPNTQTFQVVYLNLTAGTFEELEGK